MSCSTKTIQLEIENHFLTLNVPENPEQMLLDAIEGEAAGNRQVDPYWGLLWDAAPKTAGQLLRHKWRRSMPALELGCGVGLVGIAGLLAGLDVTLSDLVPDAVDMAVDNAARNGFSQAKGLVIDWREPPAAAFELIVASDVLYDAQNHAPLLSTLARMLAPGGTAWIGDAGRANLPKFLQLAKQNHWEVQLLDERGNPGSEPAHIQFQLLVLRRT